MRSEFNRKTHEMPSDFNFSTFKIMFAGISMELRHVKVAKVGFLTDETHDIHAKRSYYSYACVITR